MTVEIPTWEGKPTQLEMFQQWHGCKKVLTQIGHLLWLVDKNFVEGDGALHKFGEQLEVLCSLAAKYLTPLDDGGTEEQWGELYQLVEQDPEVKRWYKQEQALFERHAKAREEVNSLLTVWAMRTVIVRAARKSPKLLSRLREMFRPAGDDELFGVDHSLEFEHALQRVKG